MENAAAPSAPERRRRRSELSESSAASDGTPPNKRRRTEATAAEAPAAEAPAEQQADGASETDKFAATIRSDARRTHYRETWLALATAVGEAVAEHHATVDKLTLAVAVMRRLLDSPYKNDVNLREQKACASVLDDLVQKLDAAQRRAPRLYVPLTEHNEWEGETWRFWLCVNENEDALARLAAALLDGETYVLDADDVRDEDDVDTVVAAQQDGGYLAAETKLNGTMDCVSVDIVNDADDDDRDDAHGMLYKGGIRDWFKKRGRATVGKEARKEDDDDDDDEE